MAVQYDRESLIRMMQRGMTMEEVAKVLGCSPKTTYRLRNMLRDEGVDIPPLRRGTKPGTNRRHDHDEIRALVLQGKSVREIRRELGCATSVVSAVRKEMQSDGIELPEWQMPKAEMPKAEKPKKPKQPKPKQPKEEPKVEPKKIPYEKPRLIPKPEPKPQPEPKSSAHPQSPDHPWSQTWPNKAKRKSKEQLERQFGEVNGYGFADYYDMRVKTWAGAFRELARFCYDHGYQDAYDLACHMADLKGMRL